MVLSSACRWLAYSLAASTAGYCVVMTAWGCRTRGISGSAKRRPLNAIG